MGLEEQYDAWVKSLTGASRAATPAEVDAVNAAAGPFGILSVVVVIGAGALIYFVALPRAMKNAETGK